MIESVYYQNYRGLPLKVATMDGVSIYDSILEKYGENNNWNGMLWTYEDIFGPTCEDTTFYCEFHSDDGRKHWFHGFIEDPKQFFNPPLTTPMNQHS